MEQNNSKTKSLTIILGVAIATFLILVLIAFTEKFELVETEQGGDMQIRGDGSTNSFPQSRNTIREPRRKSTEEIDAQIIEKCESKTDEEITKFEYTENEDEIESIRYALLIKCFKRNRSPHLAEAYLVKALENVDHVQHNVDRELGFDYLSVNGQVFFNYKPVVGADPESFEVISFGSYLSYGKDKNSVYLKGQKITSDLENFRVINHIINGGNGIQLISADSENVYVDETIIELNPQTVRAIDIGVADAESQIVTSVDRISPTVFSARYNSSVGAGTYTLIGTSSALYQYNTPGWFGEPIEVVPMFGVDHDSFQPVALGSKENDTLFVPYAKDTHNVYFKGRILKQADPATFRILTSNTPSFGLVAALAIDKEHVYHGGELLDLNPNTLVYEDPGGLINDGTNVYYRAQKLVGLDPTNMVFEIGGGVVKDEDTTYWYVDASCKSLGRYTDDIDYVIEKYGSVEEYRPPC